MNIKTHSTSHASAGWHPALLDALQNVASWIPAFAGMTVGEAAL